jgi:hypothetical protein
VVPSSITEDCSADVTTDLQSWLDSTPDDARLMLRRGACFRIEGTLELVHRNNLVLDGLGAALKATTRGTGGRLQVRARSQVNIVNSRNVIVRDLKVNGANPYAGTSTRAYQPGFEAQHAFVLLRDDGVTLDHVAASDVYGDFVYIGGAAGHPSRHVTIVDSHFERSGRQGISVTNGDDVQIVGNTIGEVARSLIDLEPNLGSDEARNIRIANNTTGAARNFWLADKGSGVNVGNVTVTHNVMEAPTGGLVFVYGPQRGQRGPFTFSGNVLQVTGAVTDEDAVGAFVFANARNVSITDNRLTVPVDRAMPAVELRATSDVVISDNRFLGTAKPMLADSSSRNIRLELAGQ